MKGLIIKSPWIEKILAGEKVWEIRGSNTKIRGTIALIKSGSGMIYGTVVLIKSFQVTDEAYNQGGKHHCIPGNYENRYKKRYVWELSSPQLYDKPIPFKHPQGAVIWVNL
ncbi:hypothetical protein BK133_05195 [Paenibacillus sp. FSL H8-0548]|uniref:ASCH domain-containing protein n=1 Tax=Paenibacillus sp. FSL H8-0548 TaxID=1920422 RepID=UPI00096EAD52|nr:ASCH domain-containing protein [Paenibacillus sp. FSL H8-0548]OMF37453.1 hypothetical protein BK133_05195 [Paenibacillus sp. FSL H8-0548]